MDSKSKVLPGWEKYQSKEVQEQLFRQQMGMLDPRRFNPSDQEVTLLDRMNSKMTPGEAREMNNEPYSPPQMALMPLAAHKLAAKK